MRTETQHVPVSSPRSLLAAGGFLAAVAVVATVGGLAAADSGAQYARLDQPAWAPPSWLFTPVWTVLYVLIAVSGWLVWRVAGLRGAPVFFTVYALQLLLNAGWTPLFFALGWYGTAFAELCVLAASIVVLVVLAARRHRLAAVLLLPYLAWVGYAGALNLAIWLYN